ncbi:MULTISPECIES: enoyl-CoA hydratase-related protein [Sphingomonas]|uniref:Enoyl-CoA hydratase n=1 Tax=Sphingomonas bisphenolicum TaxID=296544 RepID=A0ABM7G9R0_9SPHN|nr:enoyl-CoA hydratase-related protein [Sphingomonas bisphenolicum]MBA4088995.1 crotonase [Sphingobium sp.]BBF71854.1 enoyl-CoA hydratase [Sphingomonas bisphenolicum]
MASIAFEVRGKLAEVRLNRPAALNAIDAEMDAALARAWARIDSDPDIQLAVLTGAGDRAFCAGADISNPPAGEDGRSFGGGLTGIGGRLIPLQKPLIAAVHGHVLGLGFELAMCADILIAADDTQFRLPEARAGFIDHCGVVHRAIRQLPHHVALAMIMASEPLDAARALQFGLVNETAPMADLAAATERWSEKLLACAPLVSQGGKQAAMLGLEHGLRDALERRYPLIDAYAATEDCVEAASAWKEKRVPRWRGR